MSCRFYFRNKKESRLDVEEEDDQESYFKARKDLPLMPYPDEDEEIEYDSDGNPIPPEKSKVLIYIFLYFNLIFILLIFIIVILATVMPFTELMRRYTFNILDNINTI